MTEPTIVELPDRPFVAVAGTVTMRTIAQFAHRLPEVLGWLRTRGIAPAGPPFLRYLLIDMAADLEMHAGVPVSEPVAVDGEIIAGVLPAGRYVTMRHVGPPATLEQATAGLLRWAREQGLEWDRSGERWGCRLELYHTDPAEQPDTNKWETDLQFRLAD